MTRAFLSSLPYTPHTPQPWQDGRVRGFVHPQLVTFLQLQLSLDYLPDNPVCVLYRVERFSATRLLWMIRLYSRWRTWRRHSRRRLKPLRTWLHI